MIRETVGRSGVRTFAALSAGNLVSLVGSGLSGFALSVWVYERTRSIMQFSIVIFCGVLPNVVISPIAGVLVDRFDRRKVMIVADVSAALIAIGLALLLMADKLQLWHICGATAVCSMLGAFRSLAFMVTLTLLVPKEQYGRAVGVLQFSEATSMIITPIIAGVLVATMAIDKVLLIDFATFVFSLAVLLNLTIPRPQNTDASQGERRTMFSEFTFGWRYLRMRPGLLGLLVLFAMVNINTSTVEVLIRPLVLRMGSAALLGTVLSVGAAGVLTGSVLMTLWGGPKSRIKGLLGFNLVQAASVVLAGLFLNIISITVAVFLVSACFPIINNCSQAIWQTKVAPEVQGRVFSTRRMIAMLFVPIAYLGAGPLADDIFEPLMDVNGPLASTLGRFIGVGPNRGIGLLFVMLGLLMVAEVVVAYVYPRIRKVERELPDAAPANSQIEVEKTAAAQVATSQSGVEGPSQTHSGQVPEPAQQQLKASGA